MNRKNYPNKCIITEWELRRKGIVHECVAGEHEVIGSAEQSDAFAEIYTAASQISVSMNHLRIFFKCRVLLWIWSLKQGLQFWISNPLSCDAAAGGPWTTFCAQRILEGEGKQWVWGETSFTGRAQHMHSLLVCLLIPYWGTRCWWRNCSTLFHDQCSDTGHVFPCQDIFPL